MAAGDSFNYFLPLVGPLHSHRLSAEKVNCPLHPLADRRILPAELRSSDCQPQPYHFLQDTSAGAAAVSVKPDARREEPMTGLMLTDRPLHPKAEGVAASYRKGLINRREFFATMAALGVSAA